jgi:hypothetical protein
VVIAFYALARIISHILSYFIMFYLLCFAFSLKDRNVDRTQFTDDRYPIYFSTEYCDLKALEIHAHCMLGRCVNFIISHQRRTDAMYVINRDSYIHKTSKKQLVSGCVF